MGNESSEYAALQNAANHYVNGRYDQAEGIARRLMRRDEVKLEATLLLCKILTETARATQGLYEMERLVKLHPDNVEVLMSLHNALVAARQVDRALEVVKRAFELSTEKDDAALAVGALLMAEGRPVEAEEWYERARSINPENGKAIMGLARVYSGTLRGPESIALMRKTLQGGMGGLGVIRYLTFHLRYSSDADPKELFDLQKLSGVLAVRECDGYPPRLNVTPDPERRLTIGYMSPDFRTHACAHFMEPLFAARNREAFKVIAYSASIYKDEVTDRFRKSADAWVEVATLQDSLLAKRIAEDKVDIVFDLAGHTSGTKLSCLVLHPAPLTATYIGYPDTTGAPGVDFRFVDSITDPPGAEALATERLIRVDPCFLCYRPLPEAPDVAPAPHVANGHITFGSFNAIDKVSEGSLDAWSKILQRVPGSRMVLKGGSLKEPTVRQRALDLFARRGVAPERIELLNPTKGVVEHLKAYGKMDIALDTFPYNGTTTTCEALWMGVPVVAFKGKTHSARVGASLLNAVGLGDLVGDDVPGYIDIAVRFASERERMAAMRPVLRAQMAASPLCNEKQFMKGFESAVRSLWREWCAKQNSK